jgi:hypothetical protein
VLGVSKPTLRKHCGTELDTGATKANSKVADFLYYGICGGTGKPAFTYTFTVEPYGGLPTGQADTVRLAPRTQTYLQVQWLPSWQVGYPEATWSDAPNTFGILTMSAHLAQAYIVVCVKFSKLGMVRSGALKEGRRELSSARVQKRRATTCVRSTPRLRQVRACESSRG